MTSNKFLTNQINKKKKLSKLRRIFFKIIFLDQDFLLLKQINLFINVYKKSEQFQ